MDSLQEMGFIPVRFSPLKKIDQGIAVSGNSNYGNVYHWWINENQEYYQDNLHPMNGSYFNIDDAIKQAKKMTGIDCEYEGLKIEVIKC